MMYFYVVVFASAEFMYEACFETIETIVILSKGLNSIKYKK